MKTEFLIVRHGETPWNVERRIQGWRDIELNELGQRQAQAVARHLAQHHDEGQQRIDAIYSSDLKRAQQTATFLAQQLSMPLTLSEGVRERNYGILEGIPFPEMQQHYPEVAKVWASRHPDGVIPSGETLRQFHQRVTGAIEAIAAQHQGQRVVVVTHGGAMDILWRQANGAGLQDPRKAVLLNASINRIALTRVESQFDWALIDWGNVDHLQQAETGDDVTP